jgi:hypothetical protein
MRGFAGRKRKRAGGSPVRAWALEPNAAPPPCWRGRVRSQRGAACIKIRKRIACWLLAEKRTCACARDAPCAYVSSPKSQCPGVPFRCLLPMFLAILYSVLRPAPSAQPSSASSSAQTAQLQLQLPSQHDDPQPTKHTNTNARRFKTPTRGPPWERRTGAQSTCCLYGGDGL